MLKYLRLFTVVLLLFTAMGCASAPRINDRYGKNVVLVYGFMDIKDWDKPYALWIDYMNFKKVDPPSETPYYKFSWVLGTVFFGFVEPGFYRLESFGARGQITTKFFFINSTDEAIVHYKIPMQGNGFKFEKPGLSYIGSYEITNQVKAFEDATFETSRVYYPSEEDIIVRLLEITDKGTYWESVLQRRLAQLRQWREYYEKTRKTN